ncbi:MAG: hypothetical protein EOO65_00905, partial [Methanosarcinales archaeon]
MRASPCVGSSEAPKFSGAISSPYFTQLLDMFASSAKPTLCKKLLVAVTNVPGRMTDPVVVSTYVASSRTAPHSATAALYTRVHASTHITACGVTPHVPRYRACALVVSCCRMLEVARTCHDALDVLSSQDEQNTIANLINAFLNKVDFGRDLERQLELYADARASFPNFDSVKEALCRAAIEVRHCTHARARACVQVYSPSRPRLASVLTASILTCMSMCPLQLTWRALKLVKGRHTARTHEFVKSAFAFVTITIPALDNPFLRMRLSHTAAVAALNNQVCSRAVPCMAARKASLLRHTRARTLSHPRVQCIGQADMLFRAVIQEITEVPAGV